MSKNKILFLILNFFLLICESIEDKNNIFGSLNTFNSSNILIKNIINKTYLRLLEEEDSIDYSDPSEESETDAETDKRNYIYVSFTLLQTRKKDNILYLYVLTDRNFPESITFNLAITVYLNERIRNLEEKKSITVKRTGLFTSNRKEEMIVILSGDLTELGYQDNIQKIIVNKIDKIDGNENENEVYNFENNVLKNTDTSARANVDMSSLSSENTIVNIYEVEKLNSCSDDLKFNLTVNNDIDVSERNINLEFSVINNNTRNINRRPFNLPVKCVLSSENKKIIACQLDEEPPQFSLTLSIYMEYIDNSKLIIIKPVNSDLTFTLECKEEPPIAAIISIVVLFFFVVIVVIIIIIVMNKKGRGDRGYELPNESNSNNILGLSGGASK